MFVRLVYESFRRQMQRKLLIAIAVTLGATVSTAMIGIALGIGDKISHEARAYGANLVVTPEEDTLDVQVGSVDLKPAASGAYLDEAVLPKIKGIFWRNNIAAFTPELPVNVQVAGRDVTLLGTYFAKPLKFGKDEFIAGARTTFPWWKVQGSWPSDDSQDVLVGEKLASQLDLQGGVVLNIDGSQHRVSGIRSTGSAEDDQIVAPLSIAQAIAARRVRAPQSRCAQPRRPRPLVLFAVPPVDRISVAGSHTALACRANPPSRPERRQRALPHHRPDAADHSGRSLHLGTCRRRRDGHSHVRAADRSRPNESARRRTFLSLIHFHH